MLCHTQHMSMPEAVPANDYAYYVSDWIWPDTRSDLMKSMLLFFHGIALALPSHLSSKTIERDASLAVPLAERGLLVNFDPAEALDARTARKLAGTLIELADLDNYYWKIHSPRSSITFTHWGARYGAYSAAEKFQIALAKRRLLVATKDRDLFKVDRRIRLLVLTVFAQALRARLLERGVVLHPVTESSELAHELWRALGRYQPVRTGDNYLFPENPYGSGEQAWSVAADSMDPRQLASDLFTVGTDLSDVPLDDVLDFRKENGMHYIAYATELRQFLMTQAALSPAERDRAREDRRLYLRDQAAKLRRISRRAFGIRSSVLLLSLAGASWTLTRNDPIGALLAASAAAAQAVPPPGPTVTAYSYLLRSRNLTGGPARPSKVRN